MVGQILAWPALPEIQYDEVMGQLLAQPALPHHYIVVDSVCRDDGTGRWW